MSDLDRLRNVFEPACRLAPADRAAFLDGACGGDEALRAEVVALLEEHDRTVAQDGEPSSFDADGRTSSIIQRHAAVIIVSVALLLLLGVGFLFAVWAFSRATYEKELARAQADEMRAMVERERAQRRATQQEVKAAKMNVARSSEVVLATQRRHQETLAAVGALGELFRTKDPRQTLSSDASAAELLDRFATDELWRRYENRPEIEMALRQSVGQAYRSLGQLPAARRHLERSLALRRQLRPPEDGSVEVAVAELAWLLAETGNRASALRMLEEAVTRQTKTLGTKGRDTLISRTFQLELAVESGAAKIDTAKELIASNTSEFGGAHWLTLTALANLGKLQLSAKEYPEAEAAFRKAHAGFLEWGGPDHPDTIISSRNLALTLSALGRHDEAQRMLESLIASQRGKDSRLLARLLRTLVLSLERQWMYAAADASTRELVTLLRAEFAEDRAGLATALISRAVVLMHTERASDAESLLREARALRREAVAKDDDGFVAHIDSLLGESLTSQGKLDAAEPLLLAGYKGLKADPRSAKEQRAAALERLISFYERRGDSASVTRWEAEREAPEVE